MAPEALKQGICFKTRFEENFEKWSLVEDPTRKKEIPGEKEVPIHIASGYLKDRAVKVEEEEEEKARVVTDSSLPPPGPGSTIYGFENEIKSMKNFLLDRKVYNEFKSLVVVGEYGVGKTALCKTIFNDADVKSLYAPMIWVSMPSIKVAENNSQDAGNNIEVVENNSPNAAIKKISVLKKILNGLGVEDATLKTIRDEAKEESESNGETVEANEISALLYALHLKLRWKKYLIVFDDVREDDGWDEKLEHDEEKLKKDKTWGKYLADGFPKGSGGRVIYTTRDENKTLAKKLVSEEHEIHRLWPLSDVQFVWKIYEDLLTKYEQEIPRNDKKCLDELMNKSRGVPLAIRQMATLLPVFLDTEAAADEGSPLVTTDSANNPTPGENTTTQSPQA